MEIRTFGNKFYFLSPQHYNMKNRQGKQKLISKMNF